MSKRKRNDESETKTKKSKTQEKDTLIVCHGRKHGMAKFRGKNAITVDIDQKSKPDIVGDVTDSNFIKDSGFQLHQFKEIIMENCPREVYNHTFFDSVKKLVSKNGEISITGIPLSFIEANNIKNEKKLKLFFESNYGLKITQVNNIRENIYINIKLVSE